MAEVRLQRTGINPIAGELVTTGMPKHVRMRLELQAGSFAQTFNHLGEAILTEGRAALCGENKLVVLGLAVELAQRSQFVTPNGVY